VSALALEMPASSLPLRHYQVQAIDAITAAHARGVTRPLVVLPTGSGKTVVFSSLVSQRPGRSLILAHREELIAQAARKLADVSGSLDIGIVKAARDDADARVVVASVQTLARPGRVERLGEFSTVIVDEAHHAVASIYLDVLSRLGSMGDNGPLTCGFTATAGRSDKIALGAVWQEVAYQRGIIQMIAEGYLCDVTAMQIGGDFNLGNAQVRAGDYTDSSLAAELERSDALNTAADAYVRYAKDRLGVAFTPTIATAHALAAALTRKGIPSEAVDGTMPVEQRRSVLARLHRGEIRVVPNAQVLCLDDQTEILTDSGWVGIDDMTLGHRVANWDQGRVWFAGPAEVVRRPRGPEEDMYFLETPRRSIRVTRGHRMLYRTTESGQFLKAPVQELAGRCVAFPTTGLADALEVVPEQSEALTPEHRKRLISRQSYHLRSRENYGWDESFTEAERRVERKYNLGRKHPAKLTLDECALIGFWIGDGSVNRLQRGGIEYTLSQSTVYPEIIAWVDETLSAAGLDFARHDHSGYSVPHIAWSLPRGTGGGSQQREGVYPIEPYLKKDGSPLLWGLDRSQFDALLTGLWYADGLHGQAAAGRPKSFPIFSANRQLLDLLQAIASVRGWTTAITKGHAPAKPNHRQMWTLLFTPQTEHQIGGTNPQWRIQREDSLWRTERVWCVKTESKNIITRRRGTVTVMGNTEGWDEPAVSCALMLRPTKSAPFFVQMAGRVLRPFVGKEDALILDMCGSAEQLGLATIADLAGLPPGSVKNGKSLLDAADDAAQMEQQRHAVAAARTKQVELLRRSDLRWLDVGGAWVLPVGADQIMILAPVPGDGTEDAWDVWRCPKGAAPCMESGKPLSLDWARGVGEEVARAQGGTLSDAKAAWRDKPASYAQQSALERMGYADRLAGLTRGGASDLMTVHGAAKIIRKLPKRAALWRASAASSPSSGPTRTWPSS
jgi:superfamily II DNA or RNA helicase